MFERQIDHGCFACGGRGVLVVRPRTKGAIAIKLACHCSAGRALAVTPGK